MNYSNEWWCFQTRWMSSSEKSKKYTYFDNLELMQFEFYCLCASIVQTIFCINQDNQILIYIEFTLCTSSELIYTVYGTFFTRKINNSSDFMALKRSFPYWSVECSKLPICTCAHCNLSLFAAKCINVIKKVWSQTYLAQ